MTERQLKVVIFGDTLVLAALQASLTACAGLEVLCIEDLPAGQELGRLHPDVIILDMSSILPIVFRLLAANAEDLHVIGVDASESKVLVWSGQALPAASTRDLVDLLGQFMPNYPDVA